MSADAAPAPLSKVDSAVQGLSSSPPKEKRRASSSVPGVYNILDLEKEGTELQIAPETQKLNWHINKSPMTLEDPEKGWLKKKPYYSTSQENRPTLPTWSGGYCAELEGCYHQGCVRCYPQAIPKEGR